jgi:RNA polymerase sigma-70 factor (ECF subfamily)
VFICRYFYSDSIGEIARRFGLSESKVKSMLHRARGKLKKSLESEGIRL